MEGQARADWPQFPFCGQRCRTIDLGRWLGEAYRLLAGEAEDTSPSRETEVP